MTNKEYIEKNNISFSEAMKMWNNQTNHIEDWLNQEYSDYKFKPGDILVFADTPSISFRNDHVFFVIDRDYDYLYVKEYSRNGDIVKWSLKASTDSKYHEDNTIKTIRYVDQHYFKKIY